MLIIENAIDDDDDDDDDDHDHDHDHVDAIPLNSTIFEGFKVSPQTFDAFFGTRQNPQDMAGFPTVRYEDRLGQIRLMIYPLVI